MLKNRKVSLMAVKLFVLGLPGSGKSTVSRNIATYLEERGWETKHFNDYIILKKMFSVDIERKQFKPADHGGFDIIDLEAFNTALKSLEHEVTEHLIFAKSEELIVIEFARNDYLKAFQQFSHEFLQGAYFLCLEVDRETCKRRIRERIANPSSEDDFFVSEYIFNAYYDKDNGQDIPQILEREYGIDKQRVKVIDNRSSLLDSTVWINQFVGNICKLEIIRGS
jgi:adenylate kinase family enzyme